MNVKDFNSISEDELLEKLFSEGLSITMSAQEGKNLDVTSGNTLQEEKYFSNLNEENFEEDCLEFRKLWDSIPNAELGKGD